MSWKSALSKPYAKSAVKKMRKSYADPEAAQRKVLKDLIAKAKNTKFGKDHGFNESWTIQDFQQHVPIRDYEDFSEYTKPMVDGVPDVLWPGKPLYICKTSGTTSGVKYIPISKESMPFHIKAARNALLSYIHESGNPSFVNGKMIFLQGSPELNDLDSGIPFGRLSGIVAHHVPAYLQKNRLPSFETNCIDDWEEKVDAIVRETADQNMTLISGIPAWVQMYYERLLEYTGKKTVKEVFPNLALFVYGGVNFGPYRQKFKQLVGGDIPSIETYPASEGFIAFQDRQEDDDLLLNIDAGMFFEFIPLDQFGEENPPRLTLSDVELGVNYALIMSTNAGLWGYSIGDTVKFTSLNPPRIRVSGRVKHFTSAFGEHVIAEEVEKAMKHAAEHTDAIVTEFHLAPKVEVEEGLPYHEWFVEFDQLPNNEMFFAELIDQKLQELNPYYKDLVEGAVLRSAVIHKVPAGTFKRFMESRGKLGGQNKIPRLSNHREMADAIEKSKTP